jgi:hypothetical protein
VLLVICVRLLILTVVLMLNDAAVSVDLTTLSNLSSILLVPPLVLVSYACIPVSLLYKRSTMAIPVG